MGHGNSGPSACGSWIGVEPEWTVAPGVVCVHVPASDPALVEFLAKGTTELTIIARKAVALGMARLLKRSEPLHWQLTEAFVGNSRWRPRYRSRRSTTFVIHCHGAFRLPGDQGIAVLVSMQQPTHGANMCSAEMVQRAQSLWDEYQAALRLAETEAKQKEADHERFVEGLPEEMRRDMRGMLVWGRFLSKQWTETPSAEPLLDLMPVAVTVASRGMVTERLNVLVDQAIAKSGIDAARDGTYTGIAFPDGDPECRALVTWIPHSGDTSYPEVRAAVQRRLPRALFQPRLDSVGRPDLALADSVADSPEVSVVNLADRSWETTINEASLDVTNFRDAAERSRARLREHGFEAVAWYQPYHRWSERTWGIYFHAPAIDDVACQVLIDLRSYGISPRTLQFSARLAMGMVYAHELFHARVEAASSWSELCNGQARFVRYEKNVYRACQLTSEWMEEALANWCSWKFAMDVGAGLHFDTESVDRPKFTAVIESFLDISPPGYRDWRCGHHWASWRELAVQMSTGRARLSAANAGLPIESMLNGSLPFDFQNCDIPVRFVGSGAILDHLLGRPATFGVPSWRELVRALRYFNYEVNASAGKGSHQKWTGNDGRAFILPAHDPVSRTVFSSFLRHFGIDKAQYVNEIRPQL